MIPGAGRRHLRSWWAACAAVVLVASSAAFVTLRTGVQDVARSQFEAPVDPDTACGPVSLAVMSHYLNRPVSIARMREATGAGDLGVCSIADLLSASKRLGFSADAVRYGRSGRPRHRLPMILLVDGQHFLTALPCEQGLAVIVDPPAEPQVVRWSSMEKRWRGEAVLIASNEEDLRSALSAESLSRTDP